MISFVTVGVFIHWDAKDDKKIQSFNYDATKEALARAVKGEPKASEVSAKKDSVHHPTEPAVAAEARFSINGGWPQEQTIA
jgi:5,6,7,8-tetrahydromethanopterin hydro-lyase